MLKNLLYIFVVSNLVSVQSLASVCKAKCSLREATSLVKNEKSTEHQGCHASTKDSKASQSSGEQCGDVCQVNDLIKVDAKSFNYTSIFTKILSVSKQVEVQLLKPELVFAINTHDPPGHGFFLGLPVFIQKSSFLI